MSASATHAGEGVASRLAYGADMVADKAGGDNLFAAKAAMVGLLFFAAMTFAICAAGGDVTRWGAAQWLLVCCFASSVAGIMAVAVSARSIPQWLAMASLATQTMLGMGSFTLIMANATTH